MRVVTNPTTFIRYSLISYYIIPKKYQIRNTKYKRNTIIYYQVIYYYTLWRLHLTTGFTTIKTMWNILLFVLFNTKSSPLNPKGSGVLKRRRRVILHIYICFIWPLACVLCLICSVLYQVGCSDGGSQVSVWLSGYRQPFCLVCCTLWR